MIKTLIKQLHSFSKRVRNNINSKYYIVYKCQDGKTKTYMVGDINGVYFADVKKFLGHHTIFESFEPVKMYGFNTLDLQQDWDGKLVKESFDGDDRSWLICFKGNPIINGKELRVMDYAKLENKHYDVTLNDALVGVFTKCFF